MSPNPRFIPGDARPGKIYESGPIGPDAIKTSVQLEAEAELAAFIITNEKTVFRMKEGGEGNLNKLIVSRGLGKWGLLLTDIPESKYTLWYVDCQGENVGRLKMISLDLSNEALQSTATCLKGEVVTTSAHPNRVVENANTAKKLATLIHQAYGVMINDIDNEANFKQNCFKPPLSSLL